MDLELVVTDLDGTLWELDSAVHPRTQAAIARLSEAGVPLLVATSRRVSSARAPLAAIGSAPPAVVLNGALGIDLSSGNRFHRGGFTPGDAAAVLAVFHEQGVHPCVFVDDDDCSVRVSTTPSTHPDHLASFGSDVATGDLSEVVGCERVLAFGVLGISEEVAKSLGDSLTSVATPHVDRERRYGGYTVTAIPTAQSKWEGVDAFCRLRGLNANAVLAVGDGPNDLELLDNAAVALAPEDAHPTARAHADHIVGRAADGGWADILGVLGIQP